MFCEGLLNSAVSGPTIAGRSILGIGVHIFDGGWVDDGVMGDGGGILKSMPRMAIKPGLDCV